LEKIFERCHTAGDDLTAAGSSCHHLHFPRLLLQQTQNGPGSHRNTGR